MGSVPGREAKIPHASGPKKIQSIKQKYLGFLFKIFFTVYLKTMNLTSHKWDLNKSDFLKNLILLHI